MRKLADVNPEARHLSSYGSRRAAVAERVEWSSPNLKVGSSIPSLPKSAKSGRQSVISNKSDRESKGNPGSKRQVRAEIRQKSQTWDNAGQLGENTLDDLAENRGNGPVYILGD